MLAALAMAAPAGSVLAQPYPNRVIKMIVPFSPGGQPDTIARIIAQHLSLSVGTTIIDNRPGANTTIGAKAAIAAEPDGYTLFFGTSTSLAIVPAMKPGEYDPLRSFAPVAPVSSAPFIMAVGPSVPAKNVTELVASAKATPGKLNFAAPTGGPPHLAGEMFKAATGTKLLSGSYSPGFIAGTIASDVDVPKNSV